MQFAGVEQQLKTNDQLATLVSLQQTAQATQALNFVGKTAVVDGNTAAMSNSKATWQLNVPTTSTDHRQHHQQHRPDRVHRQLTGSTPATTSLSPGTARATTARNGPTATTR